MPEGKNKVEIPFELHHNLIVVSVRINKTIPLKFILDTGVRSSILLEKDYADILGLEYIREITIAGVGNTKLVEAFVTNRASVELPGLICEGQSLLVLEDDYLDLSSYVGTDVHGIIGYEVFSRFVVEIDYSRRKLVMHRRSQFKPRRKWSEIDIEILDTKPYVVLPVGFNDSTDIEARFLIDTGASHALVLFESSHPDIRIPDKNIYARLGQGLSGEISGHLARISYLKLGKYCLKDIITSFPDHESYADTLSLIKRNGTIGGEILTKFKVVLDYFNGKMYLSSNHKYKASFEYNMSGIDFVAKGDGLKDFVVQHVRKGSPAHKAGVLKGDVILFINGERKEHLDLSQLYEMFNSREGRKIRMYLWRRGVDKPVKVQFKLHREI